MRLLDVVNLILTLSLYSNLVVRLAWEHEIGHGHLAVSIQCLDAALVNEDAQLADLAIGWSLGDRSEERRVGKECLRLCRSRWSPYH